MKSERFRKRKKAWFRSETSLSYLRATSAFSPPFLTSDKSLELYTSCRQKNMCRWWRSGFHPALLLTLRNWVALCLLELWGRRAQSQALVHAFFPKTSPGALLFGNNLVFLCPACAHSLTYRSSYTVCSFYLLAGKQPPRKYSKNVLNARYCHCWKLYPVW